MLIGTFCRLWKEWFWRFYAIRASAAEIWIMNDCDYERSRVSNITLCATYTIYRRFLGKFPRLDTADRTSWNFAGGEADFARRGTGPRIARSKIAYRVTANDACTQLVRAHAHASTLISPNFRNIYSRPPLKYIFPSLLDSRFPGMLDLATWRRAKERTYWIWAIILVASEC